MPLRKGIRDQSLPIITMEKKDRAKTMRDKQPNSKHARHKNIWKNNRREVKTPPLKNKGVEDRKRDYYFIID